jgi:hypothetical protein
MRISVCGLELVEESRSIELIMKKETLDVAETDSGVSVKQAITIGPTKSLIGFRREEIRTEEHEFISVEPQFSQPPEK